MKTCFFITFIYYAFLLNHVSAQTPIYKKDIVSYGIFNEYIIGSTRENDIACSKRDKSQLNISDYMQNDLKSLGDNFNVTYCITDKIISDIEFDIRYDFYNSTLFKVTMGNKYTFKPTLEQVNNLISIFISKYGEPTLKNKEEYIWQNNTNYLNLRISIDRDYIFIKAIYWSKTLMNTIYNDYKNNKSSNIINEGKKF